MKDTNTQSCVMMGSIVGLMGMEMLMRCLTMCVGVIVNLDLTGSIDGPEANPDQEKPDKKLRPRRPDIDIDNTSQEEPKASDDSHSDAMPQTPEPTNSTRSRWVSHSDGSERSEMVNPRKHMEDAGGEAGNEWNHRSAP